MTTESMLRVGQEQASRPAWTRTLTVYFFSDIFHWLVTFHHHHDSNKYRLVCLSTHVHLRSVIMSVNSYMFESIMMAVDLRHTYTWILEDNKSQKCSHALSGLYITFLYPTRISWWTGPILYYRTRLAKSSLTCTERMRLFYMPSLTRSVLLCMHIHVCVCASRNIIKKKKMESSPWWWWC